MSLQAEQQIREIAATTLQVLLDMGISRTYKDGTIDLPRIQTLYIEEGPETWGLVEFDTTYRPPGVRLHRIAELPVLKELSTSTGCTKVGVLNTSGITIAFRMQSPDRLPQFIRLDLQNLPNRPYYIPIGMGRYGPVWRTLSETSHILVGGESQSGKTTWLKCVIAALIAQNTPESLHLVVIDGKLVEFGYLEGIPHLQGWEVAKTTEQHIDTIEMLEEERSRRQAQFDAAGTPSIDMYNRRAEHANLPTLPRIVVIIDEVTDIDRLAGKAFRDPLLNLASLGASFGITLILSTQNPRFDVLDRSVKGNLSVRVSFRVADTGHSMTILGMAGAEKLSRTKGRMMARVDSDRVELQGYYISHEDAIRVADAIRGHPLDIPGRIANIGQRHHLTHLEREMILYAWDEMDGRFPVQDIFDRFRGRITRDEVIALGQKWERKGWLTEPSAHGDRARHVTPELAELAEDIEKTK